MITLYTATTYKKLFENLENLLLLEKPVFQSDWVVVPNQSCKKWLQQSLAKSRGICAQIEFLLQQGFYWQIFNSADENLKKSNKYSTEIVRWTILEIISNDESFRYLRKNTLLETFNFAEKMAATLLNYMENHPQLILSWEQGKVETDEIKQVQSQIWLHVVQKLQTASPVMQLQEARISTDTHSLPQDIYIFAVEQFNSFQMSILLKLAESRNIHLMLTNPTPDFWYDLKTLKQKEYSELFNPELAYLSDIGNPLLSNLGYNKMAIMDQLYSQDCQHEEVVDKISLSENTLLQSVKQDIYYLREKPASFTVDDTITISCCHSRFREVEVIYDKILRNLNENKDIKPEEIIVVAPNINDYIPYVNKIFSLPVNNEDQSLPFHIFRQDLSEQEYFSSLIQILRSFEGEMTAPEIYQLISLQSVSQRFHFSDQDIERIKNWITDSNIRNFYSAYHKLEKGFPSKISNTWTFGQNRWLSGYLAGNSEDTPYLSVFGSLSGQESLFIHLYNFLNLWFKYYQLAQKMNTAAQWFEIITNVCNDLLYSDINEEFELKVHNILGEKLQQQPQECSVELPLAVTLNIAEKAILQGDFRNEGKIGIRFQSWQNAFVEDVRTLVVMGLSANDFPAKDSKNDLDIYNNKRPRLNTSERSFDKNLMLTALTAPIEKLVITYVGYDASTNEVIPASMIVEDIANYLKKKTNNEFAITQQYMHGFNQYYFRGTNPGFIQQNYQLAVSYYNKLKKQQTEDDSTLLKPPENRISLNDLCDFFSDPQEYFLKNHAELNLKIHSNALKDTETYQPDSLQRWQLTQKIFQESKASAMKTGILADTHWTLKQLDGYESQISNLLELKNTLQFNLVDIEIQIDNYQIVGTVQTDAAGRLITIHSGKASGKYITKHWIKHLCYKSQHESYIYFQDKIIRFHEVENHSHLLKEVVEKFELGFNEPWLFNPSSCLNILAKRLAESTKSKYFSSFAQGFGGHPSEGQKYFYDKIKIYNYQEDVMDFLTPMLQYSEVLNHREKPDG